MADPGQTCWELIEGAASGTEQDRAEFVRRYGDVARSYLAKRWTTSPVLQELDDAVQEVFVECFRENGVLARANPERSGGFRAYYFGVIRNVARRHEQQHRRQTLGRTPDGYDVTNLPSREEGLARAFDRAWAKAIMRQAGERLQALAKDGGPEAAERVELLRLRFYQDKPIREIADLWNADAAVLHRQYARARKEFEAALFDVVGWHHAGTPGEVRRESERLLSLLYWDGNLPSIPPKAVVLRWGFCVFGRNVPVSAFFPRESDLPFEPAYEKGRDAWQRGKPLPGVGPAADGVIGSTQD